jgi:ubiquinone/menaquinone biosynthesis C-methylase UbiE
VGLGNGALPEGRKRSSFVFEPDWPARPMPPRDKAEAAGVTNVIFEVGTLEALDTSEGHYHMVMAHSILHLLPDRDAAIARSFRLLKPGGYFVSSTACLDDGLWFVRPVIWAMRMIGKAPRVWFFTSANLRNALRAAGFEIVEDWSPSKRSAVFIIARKPGAA